MIVNSSSGLHVNQPLILIMHDGTHFGTDGLDLAELLLWLLL